MSRERTNNERAPNPLYIGSAAMVNPGGGESQSHNRLITGVTATSPGGIGHMTFTEEEAVYKIRFKTSGGAAGDVMKVVFDASPVDDTTNDSQAAAWLATPGSSENTDVEYFEFSQGSTTGDDAWSEWFYFARPLRRADFIGTTAGPHTIKAEVA